MKEAERIGWHKQENGKMEKQAKTEQKAQAFRCPHCGGEDFNAAYEGVFKLTTCTGEEAGSLALMEDVCYDHFVEIECDKCRVKIPFTGKIIDCRE